MCFIFNIFCQKTLLKKDLNKFTVLIYFKYYLFLRINDFLTYHKQIKYFVIRFLTKANEITVNNLNSTSLLLHMLKRVRYL